jgi:peptidylprolyl isomerase/FKBP-type peptidyl-prolyl cis-trans isomerase FklB
MSSGWLKAIALAGVLAITACNRGEAQSTPVATAAEQQAFLDKNAKAEGIKVLPSGLQYKVVRSGPPTGPQPTLDDEVKLHYEGTLINGTVFDSSYERGAPVVMRPRDLVKAWQEALPMMRPGDEWYLYVPPALGYGDEPAGQIPPGSVLVFRLEVLDVLKTGGNA